MEEEIIPSNPYDYASWLASNQTKQMLVLEDILRKELSTANIDDSYTIMLYSKKIRYLVGMFQFYVENPRQNLYWKIIFEKELYSFLSLLNLSRSLKGQMLKDMFAVVKNAGGSSNLYNSGFNAEQGSMGPPVDEQQKKDFFGSLLKGGRK